MPILRFECFEYDSSTYTLKRKGKQVQLRPKVLQLLNILIENRDRVVTKSEILFSLWGSEYARDHLLFQLISELRHSPFRSDFIRTQPNLGYQWNVATRVVQTRKFSPPMQVAASFALALTCWSVLQFQMKIEEQPRISLQLPAQNALIKGVVAMNNGNSEQAANWFEFGLNENPNSAELSLLLAETLLQQNRIEESSKLLQELLQTPSLDDYEKITATDLLSHVHQRQGRLADALRYAQASTNKNVIAQCTVDVIEQRIDILTGQLTEPSAAPKMSPSNQAEDALIATDQPESYDKKCDQLKAEPLETSYCQPDNWEYLHANTHWKDRSTSS